MALDDESEPEPDISVVAGDPRDYRDAHPQRPALVVEVALSRLSFDREHKGSLYARAGIADYWIVNLPDRRVEVYRDPVPDAGAVFGWRYGRSGAPPPMRASRRWPRRPQRFQSPTSCRSYAGASTWAPNVHGGLDIAPKPPPFVTPRGNPGRSSIPPLRGEP